ncbi:MAG: M13 family metallopeptidase [Bacteroidota bacterium]|nr:M13 family metallopeptidase [Bacteroidota bacterium]
MKKILLYLALPAICMFFYSYACAQKSNGKNTLIKYIDKSNMDLSVKPGDNFYLYANGAWLKKNQVPASKTRWSNFEILALTSSEKLRSLAEAAAAATSKSTVAQRVGDLYASAMDSAAVEKLGYAPIKQQLITLGELADKSQVLKEIAALRVTGSGSPLFGFSVSQDDRDVNKYIPHLTQGGTTLPDRDYYFNNNSRMQSVRKAYLSYMTDMFKLTGDNANEAEKKANSILSLETGLAKVQMSRVEMRDPVKTYNKFSLPDLLKLTPGLDWKTLFTTMKVPNADSVLVNNPDFFKAADALFTVVPLDTWKAYLQWNVIKSYSGFLSSNFVERSFEFYKVLSGQKEITPRWQTMTNLVDHTIGELVGQLYVEKYFTAAAKQRMLALVKNVQQTFADRINRVNWMSDSTKQLALVKLHAIVNKIGFPDKWETYPGVVIKRDNFYGNIQSINNFRYNKMVNRMGKPVDKTEWGMTPPTINAYYNPGNNEIAFPAGILQFPFFDFGADDAVNYGGAAAVIGHELTHGFDDEGRQYAADGNLKDWWTKSDADQFNERAQKVVNQYNSFTVNDSLHVNGKLTLGENLADLGGLNIAYEAFKKTDEGKSDKKIDGFTADQRFFLSWAQIWRSNILPDYAAQIILTDPHSPGMYRCNGPVSNIDSWYKAFDVKPGDKMYKPEAERIKIW